MGSFEQHSPVLWLALNEKYQTKRYKPCYNYQHHQVCNWVIPAESSDIYCESCVLTYTIPTLDNPDHIVYWSRLEHAKRRFLYLMQRLNIMPRPKYNDDDRYGLRFNFLMPEPEHPVLTGHANGVRPDQYVRLAFPVQVTLERVDQSRTLQNLILQRGREVDRHQ